MDIQYICPKCGGALRLSTLKVQELDSFWLRTFVKIVGHKHNDVSVATCQICNHRKIVL